MRPDVSVIIPAYNASRLIGHTLDSVLAQRDVNVRVLVIDDCSRDDTKAVVMDYARRDPRVRYNCTPRNFGGPAGPRNLGVQMADTDWVAFCDADDLWHRDKLRLQMACASRTGSTLVCSDIEPFLDGAMPASIGNGAPESPTERVLGLVAMLLKNRVATSSVLCRRKSILDAGGFNTATHMVAVEDYDLWLRLIVSQQAVLTCVQWPLVGYRYLGNSLSASKWRQALKIMNVHRMIFARKGWSLAFPFAAPVLICCYMLSWFYIRAQAPK